MTAIRVVVGATGDDRTVRGEARRLRDEGFEIVFVGGHQGPEHLARTAVAEDAERLVVDTDEAGLAATVAACTDLGADYIAVERLM